MNELAERIATLISRPALVAFATAGKDGRPWVRYVMACGGQDLHVRFATFVNSRKVAQVRHNPEVHLAWQIGATGCLQIQGHAHVTVDPAERAAFWSEGLTRYFKGPEDPNYAIMIVKPYRIEMLEDDAFQPQVWEARR
jgi:general stress protein 26